MTKTLAKLQRLNISCFCNTLKIIIIGCNRFSCDVYNFYLIFRAGFTLDSLCLIEAEKQNWNCVIMKLQYKSFIRHHILHI